MSSKTIEDLQKEHCLRLGQIAVKMGFINGMQLKDALSEQVEDDLAERTHRFIGEILLAKDIENLESKQDQRELPTCPPELEGGKFSYPYKRARRTPHHAAVFGPTRWTNLFFPARWVIFGDIIGGPLKNFFGWGICDRKVRTNLRLGFFSHTLYWKPGKSTNPASHIVALREALNLLDK